MSTLDKIAINIIREQELIIGPVAWSEAKKVSGLHIESGNYNEVRIEGEGGLVIDRLVGQYERLFGRASIEVCKEAAAAFARDLSPNEIPSSLK